MKGLLNLKEAALLSLGVDTFNLKNVETKPSKTGNVGFKATLDSGKVVTFWSSNMDKVVEVENEAKGDYRIKPGTQITEDGSLIPSDSASNGFWK